MLTRRQSSTRLLDPVNGIAMPNNTNDNTDQSNETRLTRYEPETSVVKATSDFQSGRTPSANQSVTDIRDYSLNKNNMIQKKLDGCAREHVSIEMKQNKNLVLKFSTAAYEFAKASILEFLKLSCFQSEYAYNEETSLDDQGIIVETRFKVVNRKMDGNPGKVSKLTINCYHTSSSMLINGSKVDLFAKEGLLLLRNRLSSHYEKLDSLNADFENIMKAYQANQVPSNQLCIESRASIGAHESARTTDEEKATHESVVIDSSLYFCPNCEEAAGQNTICCEDCDSWYHYDCLGLTPAEVAKIDTDIPYICDNCNDNHIYAEETPECSNQLGASDDTGIPHESDSPIQSAKSPLGTRVKNCTVKKHFKGIVSNVKNQTSEKQVEKHVSNVISDSVIIVEDGVSNQNMNSENLSPNKDSSQTERLIEKTPPGNLFSENQLSLNGNLFQSKGLIDKTLPSCVLSEKVDSSSYNGNGGLPRTGNAKKSEKPSSTSGARSKKTQVTEQQQVNLEHLQYIHKLELKIKELEQVVSLSRRRENLDHGLRQSTQNIGESDQYRPYTCSGMTSLSHSDHAMNMRCSQQIDSLNARLKQMEVNMFQNLFLMTMNSSQVSVQLQNHANSVHNIQLQRMAPVNNCFDLTQAVPQQCSCGHCPSRNMNVGVRTRTQGINPMSWCKPPTGYSDQTQETRPPTYYEQAPVHLPPPVRGEQCLASQPPPATSEQFSMHIPPPVFSGQFPLSWPPPNLREQFTASLYPQPATNEQIPVVCRQPVSNGQFPGPRPQPVFGGQPEKSRPPPECSQQFPVVHDQPAFNMQFPAPRPQPIPSGQFPVAQSHQVFNGEYPASHSQPTFSQQFPGTHSQPVLNHGQFPVSQSQPKHRGHFQMSQSQPGYSGQDPVSQPQPIYGGQFPVAQFQPKNGGQFPVLQPQPRSDGQSPVPQVQPKYSGQFPVSQPKYSGQFPVSHLQPKSSGQFPVLQPQPRNNGQSTVSQVQPKDSGQFPVSQSQPKLSGKFLVSQARYSGQFPVSRTQPMYSVRFPESTSQPKCSGQFPESESQPSFSGQFPVSVSCSNTPVTQSEKVFYGHIPVLCSPHIDRNGNSTSSSAPDSLLPSSLPETEIRNTVADSPPDMQRDVENLPNMCASEGGSIGVLSRPISLDSNQELEPYSSSVTQVGTSVQPNNKQELSSVNNGDVEQTMSCSQGKHNSAPHSFLCIPSLTKEPPDSVIAEEALFTVTRL